MYLLLMKQDNKLGPVWRLLHSLNPQLGPVSIENPAFALSSIRSCM